MLPDVHITEVVGRSSVAWNRPLHNENLLKKFADTESGLWKESGIVSRARPPKLSHGEGCVWKLGDGVDNVNKVAVLVALQSLRIAKVRRI